MAVPSWKMAIISRRKQQEDEERRKKAEMEAYLSSLPPWKRAMKLKQLEKEGKGDVQPMPAPSAELTLKSAAFKPQALSRWKEAEEKSKTANGAEPHPVPGTKPVPRLTGSKPLALSRWKEAVEKSKTVKDPERPVTDRIVQTKSQTTALQSRAKKPSTEKADSSCMVVATSPPAAEAEQTDEIFRDPAFLAQPKWKQDLILRKRGIKRPSPAGQVKSTSSAVVQQASKPLQGATKKLEVVNASMNENEPSKSEKLVNVEGKVHRPPIFQEVDEWAGVDDLESNHKFKNLPLWHQALIKRKRDKRLLRSQPPPSAAKTSQAADKEITSEVSTPWSPGQANVTSTAEPDSQSRQVTSEDSRLFVPSTKPAEEKSSSVPSWLAEVRARKQRNQQASQAQQLPRHTSAPALVGVSVQAQAATSHTTPKKSSPPRDTSSLQRSPSNASDISDDVSEVECTLIDDLSDEEETIASLNSESRKSSTSSVHPILKGSSGQRVMRRVSFSDVQLTTEHTYPKYTYDDYFDIEQPVPESPDGLATPIHPWVSGSSSSSSSTKQPQKTLETNYLSKYSNTSFDSVLAAYAFNTPRTPSTRGGGMVSPASSATTSRSSSTSSLASNTDMYNLSNDTAALIW